jgi:predicted amidohydrolase
MQIAAVQLDVVDAEPVGDRIDRVVGLVADLADADLIVLPELWPNGGFTYQLWDTTAQPVDGPLVGRLRDAARAASVVLHAGSFIERHPDGSMTNTALLIERDGTIAAVYRKIHLFGFSEGEPRYLKAGTELAVADTSIGRVALATCYDLRFPEMFRQLTDERADLVVIPAAWPDARVAHWTVLAQARAIENQLPVVAVNTAGTNGGVLMGGRSLVVDATGTVLAEAGVHEEVIRTELDLAATHEWRTRFPALGDRRL